MCNFGPPFLFAIASDRDCKKAFHSQCAGLPESTDFTDSHFTCRELLAALLPLNVHLPHVHLCLMTDETSAVAIEAHTHAPQSLRHQYENVLRLSLITMRIGQSLNSVKRSLGLDEVSKGFKQYEELFRLVAEAPNHLPFPSVAIHAMCPSPLFLCSPPLLLCPPAINLLPLFPSLPEPHHRLPL